MAHPSRLHCCVFSSWRLSRILFTLTLVYFTHFSLCNVPHFFYPSLLPSIVNWRREQWVKYVESLLDARLLLVIQESPLQADRFFSEPTEAECHCNTRWDYFPLTTLRRKFKPSAFFHLFFFFFFNPRLKLWTLNLSTRGHAPCVIWCVSTVSLCLTRQRG